MAYVPRTPPQPPSEPKEFAAWFANTFTPWLADEQRAIAAAQTAPITRLNFDTLYAQPAKYSEGDVLKPDGVTWNPGSGPGLYLRRAAAWRFLG